MVQQSTQPTIVIGNETVAVAPKQVEKRSEPAITLEVATWEQTQEIIAAQTGKIVVLDLWSTWCEPCVKEFPGLVALQAKYPNEVVCISLNCNYIGDDSLAEEKKSVLAFLEKQKAALRNLICGEADEALYKKVGIASIPVAQVYDRTGKLLKQFDNEKNEFGEEGFTYEKHIAPFVAELVPGK